MAAAAGDGDDDHDDDADDAADDNGHGCRESIAMLLVVTTVGIMMQ